MSIRRTYAFAALSAAFATVSSAIAVAVVALRQFGVALVEALATPFNPALACDAGPTGPAPFSPLDRALQNDMRHEARMSRRAAARHI